MNRRQFIQSTAAAVMIQAFDNGTAHALTAPEPQANFHFSVMLWTLEKKAPKTPDTVPFDRCMEMVHEAGYEGIELTHEFWSWSPDDIRRIMAKMRSFGMVFDALDGGKKQLADPAATEAILAQVNKAIAVMKDLECSQMILTSGNRVEGVSPEAQRTAIVENLKRATDLVAKNNIRIALEPIDHLEKKNAYLDSVADGFEIAKAVGNPNLKVLYDFYHEQRAAGNLLQKLEENIDLVGLVHIADVPGRHEPGTGEIDYANIYRKLAELNYNKFIAMEFFPTEDPVATLKKSRMDALQIEKSVRGA